MTLRSHRPTDIRIGGRRSASPILLILLAISIAANLFFVAFWGPREGAAGGTAGGDGSASEADAATEVAAAATGEAGAAAEAAAAAGGSERAPAVPAPGVPPGTDPELLASAALPAAPAAGPRYAQVLVDGAVVNGFIQAIGDEGERVALVASRVLIWNLDLTKDPRPGDRIDVLWEPHPSEPNEMLIHGVRYESKKFQRSFEAWRFQPAGRPWASWFDADGREVPGRLTDGPIATWEQITSFIGDGRGHSGMDFKAPVGTPVTSPFDGSVVRVNWNWKFNGNCVEVKLDDGRVARYLHLSGVSPGIQAGGRVKKGQEIGKSGNTGRSNAPHLHYELSQSNGRVLDPLRVHQVEHPLLSGSDADRFKAERERLLGLVSAGGATAASAPALGAGAAPAPAAAAAAVPAGR